MFNSFILGLCTLLTVTAPGTKLNLDVSKVGLPEEARVCVAAESTGNRSECRVCAYEKIDGAWVLKVDTMGYLGKNGMNNYRKEGDKTTPIGVFKMNTPFGQMPTQEGFPENYKQVNGEAYVWADELQKLTYDPDYKYKGERVGKKSYAGYYDYCIDLGYNPLARPGKGNALFIHCGVKDDYETSGCVQIDTDQMISIMKLYGKYGDGKVFSVLCPMGTEEKIYGTYGIYNGLSPDGDFK